MSAYELVNQLIQEINALGGIGTITPNPTVVWSGPATNPPAFQPFYINENLSGLSTAANGLILNENSLTINDNLNTGAVGGGPSYTIANGFKALQNVGASATGSRQAILGQVLINSQPADTNTAGTAFPAYVGGTFVASGSVNLGGTGLAYGTAAGALYGINPNVQAHSGATNLAVVNGGEFDVQVYSGATTLQKYGIDIVQGANDAVQGSADDFAEMIASQPGAVGWTVGLSFGHAAGTGWPMYTGTGENTTLIKTWGTETLDYGIDISSATYRTASIKAPNFTVSQVGTVGAVAAALSNSTAGALTFSNSAGGLSFRNGGTSLTSPATATLQIGNADVTSPIAQTIQAQSVSTGNANNSGATLTIGGSKSNGSGSADVVVATTASSASSGIQNALVSAATFKGGSQLMQLNSANSFVAASNCGSLSTATGCLKILDNNGNAVYIPVYGTL